MFAHEIGSNGYWTGARLEVSERDPVPRGFTRADFPDLEDGQYARWAGEWVVTTESFTPPPEPEPAPSTLGRLQFIVICQQAGGMTDEMLVTAQKDPAFEAFWIKFQMASAVEPDDPITSGALDALAGAGYLPAGKAAVLAAWPVG